MENNTLTTQQKALRVNLDGAQFGTFAEIGAGQEVVRWFFHVGRASQTVAKSISAYAMKVSDDLYGHSTRYVSRERLNAMLDREFTKLVDEVAGTREGAKLFAFADTVATGSAAKKRPGHGWAGIRFQTEAGGEASEVILHFRMFGLTNVSEQEALGVLGVNLIYGALYGHEDPQGLISSLMDGLSRQQVEVDTIKFSGPAFRGGDNRLATLALVREGMTGAAMFTKDAEVVQPSEVLYEKPVIVTRGTFRPITNVALAIQEQALKCFRADPSTEGQEPVPLFEMTVDSLVSDNRVDQADFLARADLLGALGKDVLITNFTRYDLLVRFLRESTKNCIWMAMGYPALLEIFSEKYYEDLQGGILEGMGLLFGRKVKLSVHPTIRQGEQEVRTAENAEIDEKVRGLYDFIYARGGIVPVREYDPCQLQVTPRDVLTQIEEGDPHWEELVPAGAAAVIKERKLFGLG